MHTSLSPVMGDNNIPRDGHIQSDSKEVFPMLLLCFNWWDIPCNTPSKISSIALLIEDEDDGKVYVKSTN